MLTEKKVTWSSEWTILTLVDFPASIPFLDQSKRDQDNLYKSFKVLSLSLTPIALHINAAYFVFSTSDHKSGQMNKL